MIASSIWWTTRSGRSRRTRTVGQNLLAGNVLPPSATVLAGIIGRKTRGPTAFYDVPGLAGAVKVL